jgi:phospholipid-binding lipoprotein MlaA
LVAQARIATYLLKGPFTQNFRGILLVRIIHTPFLAKALRKITALTGLLAVAACSTPDGTAPVASGINDPNEQRNRKVHAFNKGLDRAIVRPVAVAYTTVTPDPLEDGISNMANNLGTPNTIVNNLLQGDLAGAGVSTGRFLMNSTIGLGGFIDAATAFNMPEANTDFGETLYVWGVGEGPYTEVPVTGPATQRDATGQIVDLFLDPLSYRLPNPEGYYKTGITAVGKVGQRGRFADTVDSVLYDSADSYTQSRLIYLQNRRFELNKGEDTTYDDPYSDPYEDPYAQ